MATEHFDLPIPEEGLDPLENINEALLKVRAALTAVDGILHTQAGAIAGKAALEHAHAIADITGLAAALAAKMAADATFSLADLTDTAGIADGPEGYVLAKIGGVWVPISAAAAIGAHGHLIAEVTGLAAALAARLEKSENLNDLADKPSARTNLGLGYASAAEKAATRASLGSASLLDVRRNRIVNPCFQISQENGNSAGTITSYYPADQWHVARNSSAGATSAQKVQEVTPAGALDRLRVSVTTADTSLAAGEYLVINQPLEGVKMADLKWGTAGAVPLVLRFMGSSPNQKYAVSIQNADATRSFVTEVTPSGANTDEVFEIAIAGCVNGNWPTGNVLWGRVYITLAAGSTYHAPANNAWQNGNYLGSATQANGLNANTNVFEFGDFGLRADPSSSGVFGHFEVPDYAKELGRSQRYYGLTDYAMYFNSPGANYVFSNWLSWQPMRTTPTVAQIGSASTTNVSGAVADHATPAGCRIYMTAAAAGQTVLNNYAVARNARM